MTGPVPIRYRAGVVGESWRVVHTAVELPTGDFRSACHKTFRARAVETVDGGGMPCERCMAMLALRADDQLALRPDNQRRCLEGSGE